MIFRSAWCCDCRARRRRARLSFAVLVFLILAVLAHGHGNGARPAHALSRPAHARTTHTRPTRTPEQSPAARKASPPARASAVSTAGQGLSWTDFHGIQLPVSAAAGPRYARGGLAWGFADTPAGALLAAVNIGVRTAALWGPAIFQPTITRQVTGPDAAAMLRADTSSYAALRAAAHVLAGQPAGRGYAVESAYRFVAWTAGGATVDVVTAGPGTGGATVLASTRIQVVWQRGDWRVVAPPGGNWGSSASVISSQAGYTIFPGER
jgi:hypothetical protein